MSTTTGDSTGTPLSPEGKGMFTRATFATLILSLVAGCASDKLKSYDYSVEESKTEPTAASDCAVDEILYCTSRGPETYCQCADRSVVRRRVFN